MHIFNSSNKVFLLLSTSWSSDKKIPEEYIFRQFFNFHVPFTVLFTLLFLQVKYIHTIGFISLSHFMINQIKYFGNVFYFRNRLNYKKFQQNVGQNDTQLIKEKSDVQHKWGGEGWKAIIVYICLVCSYVCQLQLAKKSRSSDLPVFILCNHKTSWRYKRGCQRGSWKTSPPYK